MVVGETATVPAATATATASSLPPMPDAVDSLALASSAFAGLRYVAATLASSTLVGLRYAGLGLYYLLLPVLWLLEHAVAVLALVLAPLLNLLSYALHVLLIPLNLLAKLEILYIYFGTAVAIGLITGLTLYGFSSVLSGALGIESSSALGLTSGSSVSPLSSPLRFLRRQRRPSGASSVGSASSSSAASQRPHPDHASSSPVADADAGLGRTAASFNAERASRRAQKAKEQALLGLPPPPPDGRAKTNKANKATRSRLLPPAAKRPDPAGAAEERPQRDFLTHDHLAARDLGPPPTPMMGTMILEENSSMSSD